MGFFDEAKKFLESYKTPPSQHTQQSTPKEKISSITEPIKGYTLKYHYQDVEISSWDYIPNDVKIGNKVIFIQEPSNEADDKAVMLVFVPQKRKFGYLYRGKIQDMVNDYLNRGDKVVARLSHLSFQPCKTVKIDIAFFKKNKSK